MRIVFPFLASAALLALAPACSSTTSSRNIRTAGIVALVDVRSEAPGQASVDTQLVVGDANSNTYVLLEGGDSLVANGPGYGGPLTLQNSHTYSARVPGSEGQFIVGLARDVDAPAPNSNGTLGPAFEVAPLDHAISRSGEALSLLWTPSDPTAQVTITLDGDCLIHEQRELGPDTGSVSFPPNSLQVWKNKADQTCAVDATITRTRTGIPDPALDPDSRVRLSHVRTLRFTSMP